MRNLLKILGLAALLASPMFFSNPTLCAQSIPQRAWSPYAKRPGHHAAWSPVRPAVKGSGVRYGAPALPSKVLVIMAEFDDQRCFYTREQLEKMLTEPGYSFEGSTGSAKDYLEVQMGRKLDFTVAGIVRAPKEMAWYGQNQDSRLDIHCGEFIAEVCALAAKAPYNINFKDFDEDGDGVVDNVFVFHAGEDEAQQHTAKNPHYIWSHTGSLETSDFGKMLDLGDVKVNTYACSAEQYMMFSTASEYTTKLAPIGTFCHEYGHLLGLVDLYDTDYEQSGGTAAGMWRKTALMDSGNYNNTGCTPPNFNAIDRELLGLVTPEELSTANYSTTAIGTPGAKVFRITNPKDSDEYYLLEFREAVKGSQDEFIGGSGLLVYHIDKSPRYSTPSDIYKRDLTSQQRWMNFNEVNCRPSHQCADLIEADKRKDADAEASAFSDIKGIFFPTAGAAAIGGEADIKFTFYDGTTSSMAVTGIQFSGSVLTFTAQDTYSPLPPEPVNPPSEKDPLYLIIQYSASEGSFVKAGTTAIVKVNNSVDAVEVKYAYRGKAVDPAGVTFSESGDLTAEIVWKDGTTDYLYKHIEVR